MAWIKLEHATPDKPEVVLLARTLGVSQEAAFVNLVRVLSGCGLTRAPSWPAARGTPTGANTPHETEIRSYTLFHSPRLSILAVRALPAILPPRRWTG